jgi:multicomponent Na+:H+ antiporter subunit E
MKTFLAHFILSIVISYLFFQQVARDAIPYNAVTAATLAALVLAALWLTSPLYHRSYFRKLPKAISFIVYFLKELVVANLKVAYDILTPSYHMKPTVIALPLSVTTDTEISLLAAIITLTPGTLSIDVRSDRKVLYVHTLYLKHDDVEQLKYSLKHGFERRLLELTT